jgi:hypothetical protein
MHEIINPLFRLIKRSLNINLIKNRWNKKLGKFINHLREIDIKHQARDYSKIQLTTQKGDKNQNKLIQKPSSRKLLKSLRQNSYSEKNRFHNGKYKNKSPNYKNKNLHSNLKGKAYN